MILVKVLNCNYKGRNNQNTSFWFVSKNYDSFEFNENWILSNLEILNKDIKKQNNTKVKISKI